MAAPIIPNGGRPPGSPNKATKQAREAIARFVDDNADRLTGWLDKIAKDSPEKAFNCFMSVVEYHIPKLQRIEGGEKNRSTVNLNISVTQQILEVMTIEQLEKVRQLAIEKKPAEIEP